MRNDTSATGETIVLNGNLTVTNGSRLELTDTVIRINATFDGEFAVVVENGSTLVAENVTFTRASDYAYGFVFAAGANGSLVDSVVAYVGGTEAGLALHDANVTLVNTTLRDSPFGVVLHAPATLSGNTFVNTTVGVALVDTLAANDVAADNSFENSSVADVRHYVEVTVLVSDQKGEAVEGAAVWLNDTLGATWLATTTDAGGAVAPLRLATWEVTPDTNRSLEPYNLTAIKYGRSNSTLLFPSVNTSLAGELLLRPDLVVRGEEITIQVASTEGDLLLPRHSNWSWLETDDPPSGWEEPGYDDSGWSVARASFGAGDNFEDETTEWGSNSWNGNDEALFRAHFDLPEPAGGAVLKLAVADGAIAYLNGVRVVNDLQGNQNDNGREASRWDYLTGEKPSGLAALDPGLLQVGDNVLAVQVFDTGRRNFFDAEFEVSYLEEVSYAVVNQSLFITAKLHNQGTKTAEGALARLLDNGDEVANVTVDLGVGANRTLNFPWVAFPAGNHTLEVVADPQYIMAEENESNNNGSVSFFVGDFGVNLTGEANYTAIPFTETRRFNFTVENVGDLDDNVTVAVGGLPPGWLGQVEPNLLSLAPGRKANVTLTVVPARSASQGNYTFTLIATSSYQQGTTIATIVPAGRDEATEWLWMTHELNGDDPENWTQLDFDDSGWAWDPAPFGDNPSEEGEDYNTEWDGNEIALFRHYFTIPSGATLISAVLSTGSNDNGAHFVNGVEIYSDLGGGAHWGNYWNEETAFDASILQSGQVNLLAGKVRNADRSNWFDTQLTVEFRIGSSNQELTVEILPTHDFELDRAADAYDHRFNTTVQYPLTITNFGNLNETVDLDLTVAQQGGPWSVNLSHDNITLIPGEEAEILIEVTGGDFAGGELLDLLLTARSRNFPAMSWSYALNLTAYPPTYAFDVLADEPYRIIDPGDNYTFVIVVDNLGNLDDTYDVSIASNDTTNFTLGNYTATLALPYETDGQVLVELIVSDSAHRKAFSGLNVTLTSRGSGAQRWVALDARPYYPPDVTPPRSTMRVEGVLSAGTYLVKETLVPLEWYVTDGSDDLIDFSISYSMNDGGGFGPWVLWGNFTNQSGYFPGQDGMLYRLRCLARDEYGNVEVKLGDYDLEILLDLTPPASLLWIVEDPGPVTRLEGLTLKWELEEAGEYVTYTVAIQYLVGTTPSGWSDLLRDTLTTQYWFAPPLDRTFQFQVLATDRAGNREVKSGPEATVRFDRQPPTVTLERLPTEWGNGTLPLTLTEASEPLATLGLQWASVSETTLDSMSEGMQHELAWSSDLALTWENGSAEFAGLHDGFWYYFRLLPTDAAGNLAERDPVELLLDSDGSANQTFAMPVAILPFELGGDLAVRVDEDGDGYHERLLEEGSDPAMLTASQYLVDYDARTLVLGDNDTGYQPAAGDGRLQITFAGYDGRTLVDLRLPGAARELDYTLAGNTTVRLQWRNTDDAVAYRVERTTNASLGWDLLGSVAPGEGGYTQFTDEVSQFQLYLYRVVAIDRMGYEKASDPLEVDLTVADSGEEIVVEPGSQWIAWTLALGLALIGLTVAAVYGWRHRPGVAAGPEGTRPGSGRRGKSAHRAAARQPVLTPTLEPVAQGGAEAARTEASAKEVSAVADATAEADVTAAGVEATATEPSPFTVPEGSEFAQAPQLVCSSCGAVFPRPEGETATCDGCGTIGGLPQ